MNYGGKTREVGGVLSEGQPRVTGVVRVSLHQRGPQPHPRWLSHEYARVLKAALGRVRPRGRRRRAISPSTGAASARQSTSPGMHTYVILVDFVDRCPSGPRSTFTNMLSRPAAD